MNKDRFIALVKNPALIKAEDAPFLEELLHEFPYFQSAHLLAARCYKISDSIHLQKQIKKAAAHITDRRVLYHLIENFQVTIPVMPEPIDTPIESVGVKESSKVGDQKENIELVLEQTVEHAVPLTEEFNEMNNKGEPFDELAAAPKSELVEISLQESTFTEVVTESKAESEAKIEVLTDESSNQHQIIETRQELHLEAEIPLENEIKLAIAESLFLKEFEQNITERIEKEEDSLQNSSVKEEIQPEIAEKEHIQKEINTTEENNERQTEFVAWLKKLQIQPHEPEKTVASKSVNEGEKLIEAFMEKPIQRAKPIKQEFYSPVNMAKQSVTDNDFFVTETLAKIYIKQGNLTKAIKVYQNLSLKNPEKNTFFAAQIKILKEQLHNKSGK
jgi:hypothetical protein